MEENMYPEGDSAPTPPETEEAEDGTETALLPKAFLGKCKVGEKYEVEVVGELEDEAEVKLVKKEAVEDEPNASRMETAGKELDSMEGV